MKKEVKNKRTNEWKNKQTNEGTNELINERTIMMKESDSHPHIATDEERRKVIKASAPNPSSISITRGWREGKQNNKQIQDRFCYKYKFRVKYKFNFYKYKTIRNTNNKASFLLQGGGMKQQTLQCFLTTLFLHKISQQIFLNKYSSTNISDKHFSTNISPQTFITTLRFIFIILNKFIDETLNISPKTQS